MTDAADRQPVKVEALFQLKRESTVAVKNAAGGPELAPGTGARRTDDWTTADTVVLFVRNLGEVEAHHQDVVAAAQRDAAVWIAYPKAKQLGTDLSRSVVESEFSDGGLKPVRQVTLDSVWTAVRLRSREFIKTRRAWP